MPDSQEYQVRLVGKIDETFNLAELQDLCFKLGLDYENLPGEAKAGKARELVAYCRRRNLLDQLVAELETLRPAVKWRQQPASPPKPAAKPTDQPAEPGAA